MYKFDVYVSVYFVSGRSIKARTEIMKQLILTLNLVKIGIKAFSEVNCWGVYFLDQQQKKFLDNDVDKL